MANEDRVIISTVSALASSDSKTTRTHIQKLLFFAQSWGLRKSPRFDFVMYLHGPYSFQLDKKLFEMECVGQITRKPAPDGYGARYSVTHPQHDESLTVLAQWLGPMSVRELESRATCQFFIDRRAVDPVAAVLEVKPHLQVDEVKAACSDVIEMRKKVSA